MALTELEPLLDLITEWATARYLPVHEGRLALGAALPHVTVLAREPDDVHTFFALAASLDRPTLVLDVSVFDDAALRRLTSSGAPRSHAPPAAGAPSASHVGKLHRVTAYAFASGLGRAVVFQAATDWSEPIEGLEPGPPVR